MARPPDARPELARHYTVLAVLGEGGFGKVYLARDHLAGGVERYAALKVLRSDARVSDEQRFRDEATILSLLDHPSFVKVHALFRIDGRWCIDMEYVRGITLQELLDRRGPLPGRAALELTLQVAEALDLALCHPGPTGQPLRVLHRDIKPSNLLLTRTGIARVLDFGIARWEAAPREAETTTRLPASAGYMAPERYGFLAEFGAEADVYALGVVLWEMLSAEPYFHMGALNVARPVAREAFEAFVRERLERLSGIAPPEMIGLVERMLRFEPAERPTAAEVAREAALLIGRLEGQAFRAWVQAELAPAIQNLQRHEEEDGWCGRTLRSDPLYGSRESGAGKENTFLPLAGVSAPLPTDGRTLSPWPPTEGSTGNSARPPLRWLPILALLAAISGGLAVTLRDADGDGSRVLSDCDERSAEVFPGAEETCNGRDDNCDGAVDEGLPDINLYVDADEDGAGAGAAHPGCLAERPGYAATDGDCDDADGTVGPWRREIANNGRDDDCDPSTPDVPPPATTPERERSAAPRPSATTVTPPPTPAVAAPVALAPATGRVRKTGGAVTVELVGKETHALRTEATREIPAGIYTARMTGDFGTIEQQVVVPEGGQVDFDCSSPSMGRICRVSSSND